MFTVQVLVEKEVLTYRQLARLQRPHTPRSLIAHVGLREAPSSFPPRALFCSQMRGVNTAAHLQHPAKKQWAHHARPDCVCKYRSVSPATSWPRTMATICKRSRRRTACQCMHGTQQSATSRQVHLHSCIAAATARGCWVQMPLWTAEKSKATPSGRRVQPMSNRGPTLTPTKAPLGAAIAQMHSAETAREFLWKRDVQRARAPVVATALARHRALIRRHLPRSSSSWVSASAHRRSCSSHSCATGCDEATAQAQVLARFRA